MNSLQRIYQSVRVAIAEMPSLYYGLSSLIGLAVLLFYTVITPDKDLSRSVISKSYTYWSMTDLHSLIIPAGWIAATVISSLLLISQFKEEPRGIHALTLPLTTGEKFISLLCLNWVFVPIITFGPLFLWVCLAWFVAPGWLQIAPPSYLLDILWMGPLLHLLASALWLFPTVAFPKYSAYIILGIVATIILYLSLTNGLHNDAFLIDYTPSAYATPDVVGLNQFNLLYADTLPDKVMYDLPAANTPFFIFSALAALIMMVCSALALNRKTA